ncbi:MAG: 5-formyltetrahydrofolate cyclo-ligase [Myxococcota bacterium]
MRKRFRSQRAGLSAAAVAARSARIVARLDDLDVMRNARVIASYWPLSRRREVDLTAGHRAWRARGTTVLYPRVHREGPMTWHPADDEDDFEVHPAGFLQPRRPATRAAPEVILVPGVAFDVRGHRIGYGGGNYDRTLAADPSRTTVGVAFHLQLASDLPDVPTDVPVHIVVTDEETFSCRDALTTASK